MNRYRSIVETPLVGVALFDHPEDEPHRDPPAEQAHCFSVNFVLRGGYDLGIGGRSWRMGGDQIFVTRPGLVYHCRHDEERPSDVCLTVTYRADPSPAWPPRGCSSGAAHSHQAVVALTNRLAYLRWRVSRLVDGSHTCIEAEDTAADLLAALQAGDEPGKLHRDGQLSWYAERIHRARSEMETAYAEDHSLVSLARAAGMSPFHFARVFRELVGIPPHQYLLRTRLERACEMLAAGASVTDTCFDCGFRTLSYFSRLFRQRFGVPPSQYP